MTYWWILIWILLMKKKIFLKKLPVMREWLITIICFLKQVVINFGFFKRLGTLYDLLIDLCNEKISTHKAVKEQNEMIIKIEELKNFISSEEKDSTNKNTWSIINKTKKKTQRKEIFSKQTSVKKMH